MSFNPARRVVVATWAIPEGYIPPEDIGRSPEFVSHETACLLNTMAYAS